MANVFRSKEILKKTHQENHEDNNIVVLVYGVHVSGEYTPPYYDADYTDKDNSDKN